MKVVLSDIRQSIDKDVEKRSEEKLLKAGQNIVSANAAAKPRYRPFMSKLKFWKKQQTFIRRHARHECCIVADLTVSHRNLTIEGVLLEISFGGVLFRPASRFVLERTGQSISVDVEGITLSGKIMSSRSDGYGIKLLENFSQEDFDKLIDKYAFDIEKAS